MLCYKHVSLVTIAETMTLLRMKKGHNIRKKLNEAQAIFNEEIKKQYKFLTSSIKKQNSVISQTSLAMRELRSEVNRLEIVASSLPNGTCFN